MVVVVRVPRRDPTNPLLLLGTRQRVVRRVDAGHRDLDRDRAIDHHDHCSGRIIDIDIHVDDDHIDDHIIDLHVDVDDPAAAGHHRETSDRPVGAGP
jgi:hypothetical protein